MSPLARRLARLITVTTVAAGTLFWLVMVARALAVPPGARDGLAAMAAVFSTLYLLTLVLPAFVLWLLDRWPLAAALLGTAAAGIAAAALLG
ncbi:hypothetical protein ACJ4V0_09265 [Phreatobacter sp. HK31-P]